MRFADILTTAASVAAYLGEPEVTARHMLSAAAILSGEQAMEDLGRPVSPLLRRGRDAPVQSALRELAQRWFDRVGGDVNAELDGPMLEELLAELRAIEATAS